MPTEVIIKYTKIDYEHLTNVNKQVVEMEGKEITELNIYDSNFHHREYVKDALDDAGYLWAYHGSQGKGHTNVPPEMRGNIIVDTFVASQERIKSASVWERRSVTVKFVEVKLKQQAWFHPVFMGDFMFGAAGVPFDKIYEYKERLKCDTHSCVAPNVEIGNACVRCDMSCEQSLLSRTLALIPPCARARVCRSMLSPPPKQQASPVTENRISQFASHDGSAPSSSAGFEDANMIMKRKIEELEAQLAEAKRSKRG